MHPAFVFTVAQRRTREPARRKPKPQHPVRRSIAAAWAALR